jgi:hypothetical protein
MTSNVTEALDLARTHAMTRGELGAIDVDPDAAPRSHLRALARINPAIGHAEGLLATVTTAVVPVDRNTLTASGEPFSGFSAAAEHYQARPHDGVGLALGPQPDGSALVAIRATAAAWSAWLAEHGTERRDVVADDGHVESESRSYLDPGRHVRVHWSPPAIQARATAVAVGRAMIEAEGAKVRTDRSGVGEIGWVAWSIGAAWSLAGSGGLRLAFRSRDLGHGVQLVADGVLPLASTRADGWSLTSTGTPVTLTPNETPEWLVKAFGGKWVKA